jgi:putative transposase
MKAPAGTWLSTAQVRALMDLTERHVRKLGNKDRWTSRPSESRSRNGKHEREYLLSSLPAGAQAKYLEEMRKPLAIAAPSIEQTLPLFPLTQSVPPPLAGVPENRKGLAHERYEAIRLLRDFRARSNGHRPAFRLADGRTVSTLGELSSYIGSQLSRPVCAHTLSVWEKTFDGEGYAALGGRPRSDRGQSRFFAKHSAAAVFLQNKFLHEGLSKVMSSEALVREWPAIEKKGKPPSLETVRKYLGALPEPAKVLAREGKRAHERKCSPSLLRGPVPAMDWWISDHRVFDVLVRNTLFPELPGDCAYRLWLTLICDWGSRKFVGFCFAPTPSSRTINSALRVAILNHGMPRNFYWDNGKDYKKVRRDLEEITLAEEAGALLARDMVKVGITSALPFRPRSKPIEAYFTRFSKRFDVLWRESYVGNKPGACPEAARDSQKAHKKFLAGKSATSPLPLDAEFISAAVQWIDEYNGTSLESLDHRTPNEVMEEQRPEQSRAPVNARLLDVLFSERVKRTVLAGGCVELDRMRYEPVDASLFALDSRKGRQVAVLRDPYNLGEAVAADPETLQFIGELRIQQFVAQCPNGRITRDQIKAGLRRERSLRRGYAEYLAALQAIATGQGWKTEREALLERAGVRTGTDNRPALPAAAVPGARRIAERSEPVKLSSPFVDDAVEEYLAWEREQK